MGSRTVLHPIVAAVGLSAVTAVSAPVLRQIWLRTRRRRALPGGDYEVASGPQLFESRDGAATEESEKRFSDRTPRAAVWLCLVLGLGTSIAAAVLQTLRNASSSSLPLDLFNVWADVPVWVSRVTRHPRC